MLKSKIIMLKQKNIKNTILITAGSNYLDIDAYACMVALSELMNLRGENAIAYSGAVCNYSVCRSLTEESPIMTELPEGFSTQDARYIIVDVSDPEYIKDTAPIDQIVEVYDHHVGFEEYWTSRIGEGARIEFIGAAATLIYREWKKAALQDRMKPSTARLLLAAILDNTLNLTSSNITPEDMDAYAELCRLGGTDEAFRAEYFAEVQRNVEADLKNALLNDLKKIGQNPVLPSNIAQMCVWDADGMFKRLPDIRSWLGGSSGGWLLNLIDINRGCGYFVCDDTICQNKIEKIFGVRFDSGVARSDKPYLRKQILKIVLNATGESI